MINQTWSPAGNPYLIQGDLTIPAGATLTIQAGTEIQAATSDAQGSGLNTSGGTGCISVNPQYVDTGSEDFRLQASRLCIDAGTATGAPTPDFDASGAP